MTFAKYPPVTTGEAIAVLKQDVELYHNIVHGDENTEVLTENGLVPSVDKVLKELLERIGTGTGADVTLRPDLAATNSTVSIAGVPAGIIAAMASQGSVVNIKAFGATGLDADDASAAYAAAIASGASIIHFPAGTYRLNSARLTDNIIIRGDGYKTIIKPLNPEVRCALGYESSSINTQGVNMMIENIRFVGDTVAAGFSEQKHLISINGVRNVVVQDCWFEGFRGDGLYIGTGDNISSARHNNNVYVTRCVFDGITKNNRNGISVIDGTDIHISYSYFTRIATNTMPGPIDFEPDANAYHILRNCSVQNCAFKDNGGMSGVVAVFLPNVLFTVQPQGFTFRNLDIDTTRFAGVFLSYTTAASNLSTLNRLNMVVDNVQVRNCEFPMLFWNAKGVTVSNFHAQDCTNSAVLGFNSAAERVDDFKIKDSSFIRCGSQSGNGIALFNGSDISFESVTFEDCGKGVEAEANAIILQAGTSNALKMIGCTFKSPTGKTQIAVQKDGNHFSSDGINQEYGNNFNGLPNNFPAVSGTETGDYLFTGRNDAPFLVWYKRFGDRFTELPYPDLAQALTGTTRGISVFPNGRRVAVAHDNVPYVTVYNIAGDKLSRVNPINTAFGGIAVNPKCIHVSANGQYMAVGLTAAPWLKVYKINSDGTFTTLADPLGTSSIVNVVKWNRDASRLVAGANTALAWSRSGDTLTQVILSNQAPNKTQVLGVEWFKDGELVISNTGTNAIGAIERYKAPTLAPYSTVADDPTHPSVTMVPAPNPAEFPANFVNARQCSVSGSNMLVVGLTHTPWLQLYKKASTKLIKVTEPSEGVWKDTIIAGECHDPQVNSTVSSLKWSSDSKKLAIVNASGTSIFDFSGTSFGLTRRLNTEIGLCVEWWPRVEDL